MDSRIHTKLMENQSCANRVSDKTNCPVDFRLALVGIKTSILHKDYNPKNLVSNHITITLK